MFTPTNEMGVIVLFAQQCEARGLEIVTIGAIFPDAVIRNKETGQAYRAEFEYEAANFISHGHDPRQCDLIICWQNNLKRFPLTIWSLDNWASTEVVLLGKLERKNLALRLENRRLKTKIKFLITERAQQQEAQESMPHAPRKQRKAYADFVKAMESNGTHKWAAEDIAKTFNVSVRTGFTWLSRYKDEHPIPTQLEVN